jgi:hypothetical protein
MFSLTYFSRSSDVGMLGISDIEKDGEANLDIIYYIYRNKKVEIFI